jgi:hypothetical protein
MIVTEPLFPFNILHHFKKKHGATCGVTSVIKKKRAARRKMATRSGAARTGRRGSFIGRAVLVDYIVAEEN